MHPAYFCTGHVFLRILGVPDGWWCWLGRVTIMFAKKKYLKKIIIKSAFLRARSVEIIGQFRNMLSFPKFVRFYLYRSTGIFNLLVCYITITYCKLLRHETNINQTYSKKNFVKTANESQILLTKKWICPISRIRTFGPKKTLWNYLKFFKSVGSSFYHFLIY